MYYWPQEKGARRRLPTPNLFISAFWRFLGGSPLAEVLSSCFVSERQTTGRSQDGWRCRRDMVCKASQVHASEIAGDTYI